MSTAELPDQRSNYATVDLSRLNTGSVLYAPIYDCRDVLLLAEGQMITESFLDRLRERDTRKLRAHERDIDNFGPPLGTATSSTPDRTGYISPYRNTGSDELDAAIGKGQLDLPPQGQAVLQQVASSRAVPYDKAARDRLIVSYNHSTTKMLGVYERLKDGGLLDAASLNEIASRALSDLATDVDIFSARGATPGTGGYPARHSVNTAMLALAIGVRLELDETTLRELVIGCLVHDAGMLWIDRKLFESPKKIDSKKFVEIMKHPILVFDALKDLNSIPKRSAFIAYQMHERCDGSGYPRRRATKQIHFLSKIAAVADTYVALVSPRPHRPAVMPYHAMEKVLHDANRGRLDSDAVRALLRTLSLFPIGSYVELSDGRSGRVIRASEDYTRPVIEVPDGSATTMKVLDLTAEPDLTVIRALPSLRPSDT